MDAALERIFWNLRGRDAIVFATLSKCIASVAGFTTIKTTLHASDETISFGRWICRHGSRLRHLDITDHSSISQCVCHFCTHCPGVESIRFALRAFDLDAFHFVGPTLRSLDLVLDQCIEYFLDLRTLSFPSLSQCRMTSTEPKEIMLPPSLEALDILILQGIRFQDLPSTPSLKALSLQACRYPESVVEHMGTLTTLTSLNLSRGRLTHAPHELANLLALEHLDLSHNVIRNYDDDGMFADDSLTAISALPRLKSLILGHNYLDDMGLENALPVLRCPSLKHLDICCNPCVDLPTGSYLRGLTSLRSSFIPASLGHAKSLRKLYIHGHCSKHEPFDLAMPELHHITPPKWLSTICLDDTHITAKVMNDILYLVKQKPDIGTTLK